MKHVIAELRRALPPLFRGSKIDELTGYSIAWGTVQNRRSRREIPNEDEIFIRSGNRVLVARDPFLTWFATTLSDARQPPVIPPRTQHRTRPKRTQRREGEDRPADQAPPIAE